MLFNSIEFGGFLVVALGIYWTAGARVRLPVLLAASYLFYAAWDVRFLSLIVASTVVDFVVAQRIAAAATKQRRTTWLAVSLGFNFTMLGVFKYFNFFIDSAIDGLRLLGLEANAPLLSIALPVGISFYTFQTVAYTVDVYRLDQQPVTQFTHFATFVAFFPQLVAGPIERASYLLPQLASPKPLTALRFETGVALLVRGLVLKVVVADSVAPFINKIFSEPETSGILGIGFGTIAFALQIYGDFAGYTSMARGTATLFGVDLSRNFTQPYFSISITEFWRRWHITLSEWFRDYLYIPLGGRRRGHRRAVLNVLLVMTVAGLWHGAGWNFVLWGTFHGLWLALERRHNPRTLEGLPGIADLPRLTQTLAIVGFGWLLFRIEDLGHLVHLADQALAGQWGTYPNRDNLASIALAAAIVVFFDVSARRATANRQPSEEPQRSALAVGLSLGMALVLLILASGGGSEPFIYFQF